MTDIPAGAKRPQDHQPAKAEAVDPTEPVSFTYNEVDYVIDPAFRDDVELLEDLENGHYLKVCRRIVGERQWDRWKDQARGENGRISVAAAEAFLGVLFEELGAGN